MLGKTLWLNLAFAAALGLSIGCSEGKKDDKDKKGDDKKGDTKGSGGSGGSGGTAAAAATPEDAVKGMFAAMKAGDVDTAIGYFPKGHADVMKKMIADMDSTRAACKELGDAMKAKFNDSTGVPDMPDMRAEMKKEGESVVSYEITKKEEKSADKIALTIKTVKKDKDGKEESKEKTGWAIKEADGWKLLPPDMPEDPKQMEGQLGQLGKMGAAAKKVAKDVTDGAIKTKEEAQAAFGKALLGG